MNNRTLKTGKTGKTGLAIAFLLALAMLIQFSVGWKNLLTPWQNLNLFQIIAAVALVLSSYSIRALRVYRYFSIALWQHNELKHQFFAVLRLTMQHNFYNNLLPMRSGELSFPLLMQQYFTVHPATAIAALFWFRLLDLSLLLLIGFIAFSVSNLWLGLAIFSLSFLLLVTLLFFFQAQVLAALYGLVPEKYDHLVKQLELGMPKQADRYVQMVLLSLLNWITKIAVFTWVFMQFFQQPSATDSLLAVVAAEATSVTPFHGFAGAGTFEAGMLAVLQPMGYALDSGLAAAVNLHLFVFACALLGFLASWALPLPIKDRTVGKRPVEKSPATPDM